MAEVNGNKIDRLDQVSEILKDFLMPIVTIGIAGTFCFQVIVGKVNVDMFMNVVIMVLSFWFGSKSTKNGQ